MGREKINIVQLYERLEAGVPVADIAREFGMTVAAVNKRIKDAGWRNAKALLESEPWAMVPSNTGDPAVIIMERRLDIMRELHDINKVSWRLINYEMSKQDAIEEAEVEGLSTEGLPLPDKNLVKGLLAEVLKQCDAQISWEKIYFDVTDVRRFIRTVLECVQAVSPETKDAIIEKLKRRRALSGLGD